MADRDNPDTGPQNIDEYVAAHTAPPEEVDKPEAGDGEAAFEEEAVEEVEAQADAEAGDPEAENEGSPDETEEPETSEEGGPQVLTLDDYGDVEVEIDGARTTIKDLADGTLRRADYTRKTEEVAKQRRALEAKEAELAKKQQQLDAAALSEEQEEQEPDWVKVFEEDPVGGPLQKLQFDQRKAAREARKAEAQQRMLEGQQAFRQHTANIAIQKVPEWAEGDAFAKNEPERRKLALEAGFGQEEYDSAVDLRYAVLLEWALEGRKARESRAKVEKKVSKAPKVIKPGKAGDAADREAARKAAARKKRSRPGGLTVDQYLDTFRD